MEALSLTRTVFPLPAAQSSRSGGTHLTWTQLHGQAQPPLTQLLSRLDATAKLNPDTLDLPHICEQLCAGAHPEESDRAWFEFGLCNLLFLE